MAKIIMLFFALMGLSLNGQTWGDAENGNGTMPSALWSVATAVFPPCQSEDSDWCVWDASERGTPGQGKGMGENFVSVGGVVIIFD